MKYLLLDESENEIVAEIKNDDLIDLGEGDVEVDIIYSSLNYKEMLAFNKQSKVIPNYPIIPGIDFSGIVTNSKNSNYQVGDYVLATGYDIGIKHHGGLSEKACVKGEWLVKITQDQIKDAMVYGTAGLTAALSIEQLSHEGLLQDKTVPILITGATGGVGSIALAILNKLGFTNLTALIHNPNKIDQLKAMGINDYILSDDLSDKPLQKQQFTYIIDTVGGDVLGKVLPLVKYSGSVSCCGNAAGIKLNTTVFPFILRGVKLIGIDSVYVDQQIRVDVWHKLFNEWNVADQIMTNTIMLDDVIDFVEKMKQGKHSGRTIVEIKKDTK